jgi:hypothetical protein
MRQIIDQQYIKRLLNNVPPESTISGAAQYNELQDTQQPVD